MANKLLRDCVGSSLVEFTLVFPVFIIIALGAVDVSFLVYDWAVANKTAYVGAHRAIVSDPIATGITDLPYDLTLIGQSCFDSGGNNVNCNLVSVTADCTSTGCTCTPANLCTGFNNAAFTNIFNQMSSIFNSYKGPVTNSYPGSVTNLLTPANVTISYQTTNLGFVGRPGGLPMTVTVKINCMVHNFYFIALTRFFNPLFTWLFPAPPGCNPTIAGQITMPTFTTTLPSEGLVTTN